MANYNGVIKIDTTWTLLKGYSSTKNLAIQYDSSASSYEIFCLDGNIAYVTVIFRSSVPDTTRYNQSTNDSDKSDFETNYKNIVTNRVITPSATVDGYAITTANPTLIAGSDGSFIRTLRSDSSGRLITVGIGIAGTPSGGVLSIQGVSGGQAVPVSGTVTASNPSVSTTGASPPAQATYIGGSVTTATPTYTTGQMNALSLTTTGALRTDSSGTTQPISGTVTANAGTGTFTVSGTVVATQSGTWTVQPGNTANTTPWLATISQGGNSATVSAGGALKVDGSAVTQPVSGTITANIGTTNGLALDATLAKLTISQSTALGSNTQALVGGSVTTAAPTYTTGNINPLSLTTAGALRTDSSGTTQPVSGTVTAAQATAANLNATVVQATAANLRSQTASEATTATSTGTVANLVGGAVTTAAPTYTTGQMNPLSLTTAGALRVDGSGVTQPVSGTVTSNQGTANTLANRWPVIITDGTNTMPTGDTVGRAIFYKVTDGTNTMTVKAASTAPVASDPAAVINLSPNRPATYAASTNGAIAIATNATATTSIAYIFHTSTNTKRIEIHRIVATAGLESGANHDFVLRGNFITAENGAPGGTVQTVNPFDRDDAASTITSTTGVFRSGATGAPTRVTGDLISEEMYTNTSGNQQKILFDRQFTGKPIVLRASQNEGFEIRAVGGGNGNLSQAVEVSVTIYWMEI